MRATGIVRRIDDLGRVVIPKEIRRTMHIRVGDPLEIYTARDGELIFKKYSPISELSDFANHICDSMRKSTDCIAAVCDRDTIIAVSGSARHDLLEMPVSIELGEMMENRSFYRFEAGADMVPVGLRDDKFRISAAAPVLSEGDVMGCIAFVSPLDGPPATDVEYKLVQTVAGFLGKQMEN